MTAPGDHVDNLGEAAGNASALPANLLELLRGTSLCFIATVMPDGSPQLTETWADTDGRYVLINTVEGHQKLRNIRRDPRVALNIADPANPSRYIALRGRVESISTEGASEHIETLSQRYLRQPYPWYGGREQTRVILHINADRSQSVG